MLTNIRGAASSTLKSISFQYSIIIDATQKASPYLQDEVNDAMHAATCAVHVRMRSDTHFQLGCPCFDLALLVQLPPSRKHPIPLPYRKASRHPRFPDHPDAP